MTYTQLVQDVADFLNRQDLTSVIPTFIRLAESRMNRTIRTREMEVFGTATIVSEFTSLPDDFLEYRRITVETNPPRRIEYVTPQEADTIRESQATGAPRFFSISGNKLQLLPYSSVGISYVYYKSIPALTESDPSNWLLTRHYDLYLYGTLVQAALYLKDDPSSWAALFDSALSEIEIENTRSQYQGTTPQMRGIQIG